MKRVIVLSFLILVIPFAVFSVEKKIQLPPDHPFGKLTAGPGSELTEKKCGLCHSTDYIVRQPRGDFKRWQGVVTKMIKVYAAPIDEQEVRTIADYLASAYGTAAAETTKPK
ncbi:MAG: cytochrome C [Acidobacteriia bacterium]|nr:cytochrome C [Terriglobia bacterium]